MTLEEALNGLKDIFSGAFGKAGSEVVIEEFMEGEEASFFILSDGKNILPIGTAQDHKRVFDGDQGPNTGGMGAYSPAPIMTDDVTAKANVVSFASTTNTITPISGSVDINFSGITTTIGSKQVTLGVTFSGGVANPEINKNTGDIIYIDNRSLVTRDSRQKEDIKIILEF